MTVMILLLAPLVLGAGLTLAGPVRSARHRQPARLAGGMGRHRARTARP
ncbi:hypothetical protein [Kitasatospora sp. NPDC098663]